MNLERAETDLERAEMNLERAEGGVVGKDW
jgi:hypothetical protein